ncbi:hypothetical protein [Streptomyces sp. NPDC005017]|uniref:hypothetical protein n=1 Tax=Streptomyces sp. NPDC005017 TaxID=3364706 RepID=UPI0036CE83F3
MPSDTLAQVPTAADHPEDAAAAPRIVPRHRTAAALLPPGPAAGSGRHDRRPGVSR